MAILDRLQAMLERFQVTAHGAQTWPPPSEKERWEKVEAYRRYFENDYATMLQFTPEFNKSPEGKELYTPVGVAGEVCRFSADLLFSAEPTITFEDDEQLLMDVQEANGLAARLVAIAESIAVEGRGGLRVIRDDDVSDLPLITHVHENQIIWDEKHGAFVMGGVVVAERPQGGPSGLSGATGTTVYRMLEEHSAGLIERRLYKGMQTKIGQEVELSELDEFKDLPPEEDTGLDSPTLIRWDNVSGGLSDLKGQEKILDRINAEYSYGGEKSKKSRPVTFADASLADERGKVDLSGIQLMRANSNTRRPMGDDPAKMFETVQPDFKSQEIIAWIDFLLDSALLFMGYSKASYGRDQGGSADSGKALKLRQARTLLKKAGKDRMSIEALKNAYAVALCWAAGESKVADSRPEIKLGDGLPRDSVEDAQEAGLWESAGAISLEEKIRMRRPDWDDDAVMEEIKRIRDDVKAATPAPLQLSGEVPSMNGTAQEENVNAG